MGSQQAIMELATWFVLALAACLTCVVPRTSNAQATANPVTNAGDAFGFRNGDESVGIYTESSVRGFDLEAAGNYRINGSYFVKSSGVSSFFLETRTVRIGYNTLEIGFPGPSGVIDFRLRDPAHDEPSLVTVGLGEFNQPFVDALYKHRAADDRFSTAVGVGVVTDLRDKQGGTGHSWLVAGAARVNVGQTGKLQFFGGEYAYDRTGATYVTTEDGQQPPRIERGRYFGQNWAQEHGERRIAGVLFDRSIGSGWATGVTAVFSEDDPSRSYTQLFANVDAGLQAQSLVVASPHQRFTAWSGESRTSWSGATQAGRQRISWVMRGRASRNRIGGDQLIDLGTVPYGEPAAQTAAPDLSDARATIRNEVDQIGFGLSYQLDWKDRLKVSTGLLKSFYQKRVTDPATSANRSDSAPWLYNVGAAFAIAGPFEVYASSSLGLEEAGTAPSSAANAGSVLDAILVKQNEIGLRYQIDEGLSLIVAGFSTVKPYAGIDGVSNIYRIVGDVRHRGVEASLAGNIGSQSSIILGGVYLQPRLKMQHGPVTVTGRPIGVPELRWIANGDFRMPYVDGLSIDLGLEYVGPVATRTKGAPPSTGRQPKLSRSLGVNVGLRYRVESQRAPLTLRAQVLNVLDDYHWTVSDSELMEYGPQRRFRLVLTGEF
jgi:iron complex outermembrane receptor protein